MVATNIKEWPITSGKTLYMEAMEFQDSQALMARILMMLGLRANYGNAIPGREVREEDNLIRSAAEQRSKFSCAQQHCASVDYGVRTPTSSNPNHFLYPLTHLFVYIS